MLEGGGAVSEGRTKVALIWFCVGCPFEQNNTAKGEGHKKKDNGRQEVDVCFTFSLEVHSFAVRGAHFQCSTIPYLH